jgi:hypothetical protein
MAKETIAYRDLDGILHDTKREAVASDKRIRAEKRENAARLKRLEAMTGIEGEVFELMRRVRADVGMPPIRAYFALVGADDVEHLLTMKDKLPAAKTWAENVIDAAFNDEFDGDDI